MTASEQRIAHEPLADDGCWLDIARCIERALRDEHGDGLYGEVVFKVVAGRVDRYYVTHTRLIRETDTTR